MTPLDDNDLIARLQSAIAERQAGISAHEGIGDAARRAAHRRTATRAVGAGVPVLAAAGVATVLAISSGSGSPGGPSARGSGGSENPAPAVSLGAVKIEDTADILKRVQAKVAGAIHNGTVLHAYSYFDSHVSSDGSLVSSGPMSGQSWEYTAPDGAWYTRNTRNNRDGSPTGVIGIDVLGPVVNGRQSETQTIINTANHTYSRMRTEGYASGPSSGLGLQSSPSEVQQALRSGHVTQKGRTTVHGTPTIALSLPDRRGQYILYVNARTGQPLRTVITVDGNPSPPYVTDWIPATPDNIAKAEDDSIPAGYKKVDIRPPARRRSLSRGPVPLTGDVARRHLALTAVCVRT
jgi:hypothetical protein